MYRTYTTRQINPKYSVNGKYSIIVIILIILIFRLDPGNWNVITVLPQSGKWPWASQLTFQYFILLIYIIMPNPGEEEQRYCRMAGLCDGGHFIQCLQRAEWVAWNRGSKRLLHQCFPESTISLTGKKGFFFF